MKKIALKIKELYNLGLSKHEANIVNDVLSSPQFGKKIDNRIPKEVKNIAFIIPGIEKYAGGITSILRLGSYLADLSYNISFVDFTSQPLRKLEENASYNLKNYRGKILSIVDVSKKDFDIVIACNWNAVYYVNYFEAYKMYFVQDFEPYFFKLDERYLLAKLTYELGLHIVSLGKWNIEQIERECKSKSKMDWINFPYEPKEYSTDSCRDFCKYKKKKTIKIAVYTKEEGKRIPNILQSILKKTRDTLKKENEIDLQIIFFGLKKSYHASVGKNVGKLNREELFKLYNESDFGMVASMTNVSLVPYEMIASGLPVIEFESGSFPAFFPENTAFLINYDYNSLVDVLRNALTNPNIIEERLNNSLDAIRCLSWENTALEFKAILNSLHARGDEKDA